MDREPDDEVRQLEIPGGVFFELPAEDRDEGMGFAVQDGQGANLWTAFRALGGVPVLGYPASRRFEWQGAGTQLFEQGVLTWNAEAGLAVILPLNAVRENEIPEMARRAEYRPVVEATAARAPWSGWWWPTWEGLGPTLAGVNGPLDKYDRYVGFALGEPTRAREWERQANYFPGNRWAGHCNGFAAAALLEEEPTEPRTVSGVSFTVADLKGLLSYYHFADAAAWSYGENGSVNPADFHRTLLNWLGGPERQGFVLTFDMGGGETWSYPAYRFTSSWKMDPVVPYRWQVTSTVWMADMNVPTGFVGVRTYPGPAGKTFEYTLDGDPWDPTTGAWTGASAQGRFAHPGRVWYPDASSQNLDAQWISPHVDRGTLENIMGHPLAPLPTDAVTPR
jgi:hypothetical protein